MTLSDNICLHTIADTTCNYEDTFSRVLIANSEGAFIEEERPMIEIFVRAVARDGDNVQTASESRAGQKGFDLVQGHEELVQTVAQRAVDLKIPTGAIRLAAVHQLPLSEPYGAYTL